MRQLVSRGLLVLCLMIAIGAAAPIAGAAALDTGWTAPFSGTPQYVRLAPPQAKQPRQINAPIGAAAADRLAASLGFDKSKTLSPNRSRCRHAQSQPVFGPAGKEAGQRQALG